MGKKTAHRNWSPERAWQVGRAGSEGTEMIIGALALRKDGAMIISDRRGVVLAAQAGAGVYARRSVGLEDTASADGASESAEAK